MRRCKQKWCNAKYSCKVWTVKDRTICTPYPLNLKWYNFDWHYTIIAFTVSDLAWCLYMGRCKQQWCNSKCSYRDLAVKGRHSCTFSVNSRVNHFPVCTAAAQLEHRNHLQARVPRQKELMPISFKIQFSLQSFPR